MNYRGWLAEFVGTFALVFVGVGAVAATTLTGMGAADQGSAALIAIALAHGLVLAVMISATMAISGGHLNPAVTMGALVGGKIDLGNALGYWFFQFAGAVVGAFVLSYCMPAASLIAVKVGTPLLADNITVGAAVGLEGVLTFFLVFVVYGTGIDVRAPKVGGLYIGLTVAVGILVAGPLTGAALNPARHLGPALIGHRWADGWVYYVGPLAGGIVAGLLYRWLLERPAIARKIAL